MSKKRVHTQKSSASKSSKGIQRIVELLRWIIHFITYDIWRITESETKGAQGFLFNTIKVVILSIRRYKEDKLQQKASALTYYTALSIVPVLALIFGIARGFGYQNNLQGELEGYFNSQLGLYEQLITFINSYLDQTKQGVFIGIGLIFLFWSALNLISTIEHSFNDIWQVKRGRTIWRKITDYFSLLLILPILLIASSGLSIFLTTHMSQYRELEILDPLIRQLLSFSPYFLTWILFSFLYMYIPNIKVKFKSALLAGIITGTAFQLFQFIYINGQIGVTRYNAIYGSFAAIPLFLLWLQISWLIILVGAEVAFAGQNIHHYDYENETNKISRRYKDFLVIVVVSLICKRFEKGLKPYTIDDLSKDNKIPIRLTSQIINELLEMKILNEVVLEEDQQTQYFQPAYDVNKMTIAQLLETLENYGSENFDIDKNATFAMQWQKLIELKKAIRKDSQQLLVKDL